MRSFVIAAVIPLTACMTSMTDLRTREVQDDVVTARTLEAVQQCLLTELASMGRQPFVNEVNGSTEVAFSTTDAGVIFHYTLTDAANGTRVQARRKNTIANGFDDARECYI